jgi:hypothetical protein
MLFGCGQNIRTISAHLRALIALMIGASLAIAIAIAIAIASTRTCESANAARGFEPRSGLTNGGLSLSQP